MTAEQIERTMQGIFDGIFNSATKAAPGGKPVMPASTSMLTLMKPGLAIRRQDFENPWTRGNINGSTEAAINTALLVDAIPEANSLYTDSTRKISQVYGQIVKNVQIPVQPDTPALLAIRAQYEKAHKFLYRTFQFVDEDGVPREKMVPTDIYYDYMKNQEAYNTALGIYNGIYQAAVSTPQGAQSWPFVGPTYQKPVKTAWDFWRANKADKVEENLAIMQVSSENALQKAFADAQYLFESSIEDVSGTKINLPRLLPSDWYSSSNMSGWTTVRVDSGATAGSASSDYKAFGASAGFSLGIFSIGAKAGGKSESRHFSTETNNLSFQFSYKRVGIYRPYLMTHLLGLKGWNLSNLFPDKGQISNGTKKQPTGVWPLLPTAFVVVKGVTIKASWAKSDWELMKSTLSLGGSVGIGPFNIGGQYSQSKSKETWSSAFANGTITVPGVQIIGLLNSIVPFCPSEKGL